MNDTLSVADLIEEYDIRTAKDIEDALRDLMGGTIQEMLEAGKRTRRKGRRNGSDQSGKPNAVGTEDE